MTGLPPWLRTALIEKAEGQSRNRLSGRSDAISSAYRQRKNSATALLSDTDALAYALARMPATYAATAQALAELRAACPDLSPETLLDVGCGPGTASFAAAACFESLSGLTLFDRNGPFLEMARDLSRHAPFPAKIEISLFDLARSGAFPRHDLVVASYVLAELPGETGERLVDSMWAASTLALVLVEPGTPDGFKRLAAARTRLIAAGGHVAAPCTHHAPCPMSSGTSDAVWCRFFVRVPRSRDHMKLKGGTLSYEDEPFAYLVVTREPPERKNPFRIVGRRQDTKIEAVLPVCGVQGLDKLAVPTRDKEKTRLIKRLDWGDQLPDLNQ